MDSRRNNEPCILVIFGATGDLTSRKLMPALYNLMRDRQLPERFACVGFARREKSHEDFRKEVWEALQNFSRAKPQDDELWKTFSQRIFYHRSEFDSDEGYQSLQNFLQQLDGQFHTQGNRLFYLSTQPSYFPVIVEKLKKYDLVYDFASIKDKWSRLVIEKPFGEDLTSAVSLQNHITQFLSEDQIYRIDHYLGKETVQNLMVFRFGNTIFESLWNNRYIDNVQITVAEEIGIGTRGRFFEEAGILRDIIQNHVMQLLALVAMEPPNNITGTAIRDEKVKVLNAIRPIEINNLHSYVVRGQYGPGQIGGTPVVGYRQEQNVSPSSCVETYMAMQLFVDNWRWFGVPFFLRAGKRLPRRTTEIAVNFKSLPGILFRQISQHVENNALIIRIQPNEGIALKINCKVPGPSSPIQPVRMDFRYDNFFGLQPPEAYERLICDAILGDSTLFIRWDEVYASWRLLTPILQAWAEDSPTDFPNYSAGTWGPDEACSLLAVTGRNWRRMVN